MKTPETVNRIKRLAGLILVLVLLVSFTMADPPHQAEYGSFILKGSNLEEVSSLVHASGGQVSSKLELLDSLVASLPMNAVAKLETESAITSVVPNAQVKISGNGSKDNPAPASDYPDVIGADLVWEAGVTGEGVTVAVVDTGLSNHPGLLNKVNGVKLNRIAAWADFVEGSNSPRDPHGHGTHIAGIIANAQQGPDGEWNGVAPGVRLVGVRVLDEEGYSDYATVIEGIEWVIENKEEFNIKVMNLSLVSPTEVPYWVDPLNEAVMLAWANGITVVVAAGNDGSDPMTIGVPGNNPYVITVGAFTDNHTPDNWNDDYLAPFSAAGPTKDAFTKPDVLAPGAHMVSSIAKHSTLENEFPGSSLPHKYFWMAGTSQASAVVSGLAALTLAENPELTPDEVKYRLMVTALPWVNSDATEAIYSIWQQGAGRVNAPDAVFAEIEGQANTNMDIWADLAGTVDSDHYEGFTIYDEENGLYRLRGDFSDWTNGYGAWAGDYDGEWTGGYGAWAGGYGAWAGGYGAWAGGYGAWAGGYGAWAGGYGAWAGGYGAWAGGYGAWAGHDGAWAGSFPDQGVAEIPSFSGIEAGDWVDFDG